jgi:MFS transporter, putative metabolite:H+ symporter
MFFGSGIVGSALFVYAGELYPTSSRATGLGWAAAYQKLGGLIAPLVVGMVLSKHIDSASFFVLFAVIAAIGGLSGLIATFETRGKNVEQIAADLALR